MAITVPVGGYLAQKISTDRTNTQASVQIAIDKLSEPAPKDAEGNPMPFAEDKRAIRAWAVQVVNKHATVKIPEESQRALVDGLTSLTDEMVAAKKDLAARTADLEELKVEHAKLDAEQKRLEAERTALRESNKKLETGNLAQQKDQQILMAQNETLRKANAELEKKNKTLTSNHNKQKEREKKKAEADLVRRILIPMSIF